MSSCLWCPLWGDRILKLSVVIKNCPTLPGREGWAENFTCVCVFQFPSAQITPYARVAYFGGNGPYPFRLSHAICGVLISSETLGVQAIPMQTHLGSCPQPQLHKWVRGQGPSPGGRGGRADERPLSGVLILLQEGRARNRR